MEQGLSYELIKKYLHKCEQITEKIMDKALTTNELTERENKLAKEVSHVANVLSAIYFYRQEKNLELILRQMHPVEKQTLEPSLRIIWKYLSTMNESQIADLAVETIQASSQVTEALEMELGII